MANDNFDQRNSIPEYDVLILGAGLSGLYAASILSETPGVNFAILEARSRVGGRTLTKRDDKVGWVDLGGSYVGPQQLYMHALLKKLNIKTYKVHGEGKSVYLNKKQRYLHACDTLPCLGSLAELEIRHILQQIDRMCTEIPLDEPWKAPQAAAWDQITFAQYLNQNCWTREAKDFVSLYMSCCTSCESHEGSLLWTLWFTKQCEGLEVMYNVQGAAQDSKLCGGTQQISHKLLERIEARHPGEKKVLLDKTIMQIIYEGQGVDENNNNNSGAMVVVKTLDGSTYRCRYLINTIPISLQQKIHFTPSLPPLYNQMMQKFPMGSVIKCIVYYKQCFWRRDGLNGNVMINLDAEGGPITYTLDDTKPDGTYPAIVGFIIGNRAKAMLAKSKDERLRLICDSFAKAFGCEEARQPIHYEEKNWMSEQYTGGCFTAYGQTGFLTTYGDLLRKPLFGCIIPAGTETSIHWAGYMEGALQAGERAALMLLKRFKIAQTTKPLVVENTFVNSNLWRNMARKEDESRKSKLASSPLGLLSSSLARLISWSGMFMALMRGLLVSNI